MKIIPLPYKIMFLVVALIAMTGFAFRQKPFARNGERPDSLKQNTTNPLPKASMGEQNYYVCPMHPDIISEQPGTCPVCGMDLVMHHIGHGEESAGSFPGVRISPTVIHNLGIKTAKALTGDMQQNIETIGKITRIDHTARRIITPPVSGVITYITDKQSGDDVQQGELLFKLRSSQILELQSQFKEALLMGDMTRVSTLLSKLRQSGLNEQQIAQLKAGAAADFEVEVYAQEDGYVFSRRGEVNDTIPIRFTVFNIGSNYQSVEVTAEIFERQWGLIAEGQKASMTVRGIPGVKFEGTVVRVEPPVGYTTRSLEVALKFKTDHPGLYQSLFAHVNIQGKSKQHILMVPTEAVIRTGQGDRVVLTKGEGYFQPVTVVTGEENGSMIEIISGLKEGDRVVASGQFLIDSESNLQAEFQRMADSRSGE